ncbi:SDR family oxidoreductase [Brevibacterium sp. PAMC21349]|nr:SDR family oxidoreductase [Brevibacterium sp. PAMC21349]
MLSYIHSIKWHKKKPNAWTPLIPATFDEQSVAEFGTEAPLGRPGQPADHAGAYVLLASDEGAYITGQCIHINGGITMSS